MKISRVCVIVSTSNLDDYHSNSVDDYHSKKGQNQPTWKLSPSASSWMKVSKDHRIQISIDI